MRISDWSSDVCSSDLILPFTREQESEADHIGLMLMAKAGYDPRGAVELWQNFDAIGGERPPEFLSTHPAPGSRIANPEANNPKAPGAYAPSPHRQRRPHHHAPPPKPPACPPPPPPPHNQQSPRR